MVTHGELMDAAVSETGLDDFGDDSFREGLEILVTALGAEARLNAAGEGFIYPRIIGYLEQRLQVIEGSLGLAHQVPRTAAAGGGLVPPASRDR